MGGVVNAVSDVVGGAVNAVEDLGHGIDKTVRDVVPGGWTGAALLAAGAYYAPEIGAWLDSSGAVVPGSAGVAPEVGAVASPVTSGAVTATDLGTLGSAGAGSLSPVVATDVGSWGAVAPVTAGAGAGAAGGALGGAAAGAAGAAAGSGMSNYLIPGAILGSSVLGAAAANKAAGTQADAANQANQLQYQMWKEQQALQEPWRKTGINALNKLNSGDILGNDPGYAFRLAEGQRALERQAAARGGLISGAALKAATKYGQDMGSQEYQNAFNRYATLAGYGQSASNTLTNAASTAGSNIGAGITSAAAANAAGSMGTANALSSGLGQYLNYASNQDLMNTIRQSAYAKA